MSDFPFSNWVAYFSAFSDSLDGDTEKYPVYSDMHDTISTVDIDIVKDFLNKGFNAQEGLNKLVRAVLDGARYAKEMYTTIEEMVFLLMDHGAIPNMDQVFGFRYPKKWKNFEDEMQHNDSRVILVKVIGQRMDISQTLKTFNVEPIYWEDIEQGGDYTLAFQQAVKYDLENMENMDFY